MNTITQTMRFRQALIKYSLKHGVTKAAIRYKTNRQHEQMSFPGQRVQIDVKFVPVVCCVGDAQGKKFYQYTSYSFEDFSKQLKST